MPKTISSFLNVLTTTINIPNAKYPHTDVGSAAQNYIAGIIHNVYGGPPLAMLSSSSGQTPGRVVGGAAAQQAPGSPARPAGVQQAATGPASGGRGPQTASSAMPAGSPSNYHLEWSARVRCDKYELGDSFSVIFFVVTVPHNPAEWTSSPYYVGSFHVFGGEGPSDNRSQPDYNIQGFVHLDDGLIKHSGQRTLEPDVVVPFLTDNLHWRVQKTDGTVVELSTMEVMVLATPVTLPPGARFPVYGEPRPYPSITRGRPGGSGSA